MSFDIWKLVDSRSLEDFSQASDQLICDIDKTYLETAFESLSKLAKIPFEKFREKITVSGAKEVLQAFRQGDGTQKRPVHFVSSSPPQLRQVLSDKLRWDNLSWSTDTLKNQSYYLSQGRFRQVRNQVAYKSAAILRLASQVVGTSRFHMIGDTAEADAAIYLGIKLFAEKRLTRMGYLEYLNLLGVPRLEALLILRKMKAPNIQVGSILVRSLPGYTLKLLSPLTDPILQFSNYFEASLYFLQNGLIDASHLPQLTRAFHRYHGMSGLEISRYLELLINVCESDILKTKALSVQESLIQPDMFIQEKAAQLLTPPSLDAFDALTEKEILGLAAKWRSK